MSEPAASGAAAPGRDCPLCPRLAAFRDQQRAAHPDWHNAPVPSFGPVDAPLLVVGLAPGLRGANRTGRPFTGDWAGDLLYGTLAAHGFTSGTYAAHPGDGFALVRCRIANAARCVPPENKPTPAEIATCRRFLEAELAAMPALQGILALGRIAHDAALSALGRRRSEFPFAHGRIHEPANAPWLADSYHSSRYNTNTGRLTPAMFDAVIGAVAGRLDTT
ncbi:MAG: uracil-DNA glycosylase [Alphaproteobacteria bacterium]|nr:uracil-DNA glycosylase [Alphaproteobacteria bacterium]